jgi:hypothetical protein
VLALDMLVLILDDSLGGAVDFARLTIGVPD